MTKELTAATFDYEGIDKDTKGKLVSLAGQFNNKMKAYKQSWMDLGEIVSDAHDLLSGAGKDGKFAPWIEANLNVTRQTAYRYMWAWERFGKCNSVLHFTTEALYELSGPNVPEKAVKEAIKLADKGEKITKPLSGELIDKHTVEADDKPPRRSKLPSQSDAPPAPAEDEPGPVAVDAPVKQYNDPFDPATFAGGAIDLAAKQAPYDEMLNAVTVITKAWNRVTADERDGVYAVDKKNRVEQLLRDLRPPIAQARPHAVCDHCEGKGCKKCQNCGWWPRSVVEGLRK